MDQELEFLRRKRLKWIEANRENNFEEGIKRLLTDLYPDNAHFVYELLQNAEDPHAETVRFSLSHQGVAFEHNGTRLFDLKDVESITSIGASTKRDDPTTIGKFGIGFKAVFAYTSTPEIRSGQFQFRIHDLVVPEPLSVTGHPIEERSTRFQLPFDHPTKRPQHAVAEVKRALKGLGDNTLLFLSHIRKIEYRLPDGESGSLRRVDHGRGHVEILAKHPGGEDRVSHWLRYQNDVEVTDDDGEVKSCRVAIAYKLEPVAPHKKTDRTWKIVPLDNGQVSIYFPAEKEVSNLRFHMHAPFASTVARDSVRDCEANRQLRDRLAELVVESLNDIRDRGMLAVDFLSVLPNPTDNLPSFYGPIQEAIVDAFKKQSLTPTRRSAHAPAASLLRGPAKICEVLSDEDIALLSDRAMPVWAANPPQQNQREDRFLDSLAINKFSWSELTEIFSFPHSYASDDEEESENENHQKRIESWIGNKDDAWLMRFYALLGEACDVHNECMYEDEIRIVRCRMGNADQHVVAKEAFFSPGGDTALPEALAIVKATVYDTGRSEAQKKHAVSFLEYIGVRRYDATAAIELKLHQYDNPDLQVNDSYFTDLKLFITHWKKNTNDAHLFVARRFLLGGNNQDPLRWCKPTELVIDSPYKDSGLAEHTTIHKKFALWPAYTENLSAPQSRDFIEFLLAVGVMDRLNVSHTSIYHNPLRNELWKNSHGTRSTHTGINEDYSINGLDQYIKLQSISASRLVWHALISAESRAAKARYRPNQQYETREVESQLVQHLKSCAWIPDRSGGFHKPLEMGKDELRDDFPYDDRNGLLTAIGFGERSKLLDKEYKIKNAMAKAMGFASAEESEEIARIFRETGLRVGDLRLIASQRQRAAQPEDSVTNPARRRKGILERRDNAPTRETITRERTIQPGVKAETVEARAYLRAKYRNVEGQVVCQCCHTEMPFKVNGEHYFEAIQCVRGLDHHYFENRLALCPTCAAMYQHARETNDQAVRSSIINKDASDTAAFVEIPIRLAGRNLELRFVGTHWFDLKIVLKG